MNVATYDTPIRVLIADDHTIVRETLAQIITESPGLSVVAQASESAQVMALLDVIACDVVVLDINMPVQNGFILLKHIQQRYPGLPVLMLSFHPQELYASRVVKAGASGYLVKDAASDHLAEAIRILAMGGQYPANMEQHEP